MWLTPAPNIWTWSTDLYQVKLDSYALSQVKTVTMRFCRSPLYGNEMHLDTFLLMLSAKTPLLHTLRLAEHYTESPMLRSLPSSLPQLLPASLAHMTLKQTIDGRQVIYEKERKHVQYFDRFRASMYSTRDARKDLWTHKLLTTDWHHSPDRPGSCAGLKNLVGRSVERSETLEWVEEKVKESRLWELSD
jgi:hypothetical protein